VVRGILYHLAARCGKLMDEKMKPTLNYRIDYFENLCRSAVPGPTAEIYREAMALYRETATDLRELKAIREAKGMPEPVPMVDYWHALDSKMYMQEYVDKLRDHALHLKAEVERLRAEHDALSVVRCWWAMVNAGRELDGDPPLKDDDVILHFSGNGASCMVTAKQLNTALRAELEGGK